MNQIWKPFYKAAKILLQKSHFNKYYSNAVKRDIKELVAPMKVEQALFSYYQKRMALSIFVIIIGSVLAVALFVREQKTVNLKRENDSLYIERDAADGENKNVTIIADMENSESQLTISVEPRKYTNKEFLQICKEISDKLPDIIKGNNADLEHVNTDLNFIGQYQDYPINLSWNCDDYTYIHTDGTVKQEALKELKDFALAQLCVNLQYEEYEEIIRFPIRFIRPEYIKEQQFKEKLVHFFEEEQKKQRTQERFVIPTVFDKKQLSITEKKDRTSLLLFLVTVLTSILLFFGGEKDLHNEVQKRRTQLIREYPDFVSKLVLYMGAGMTTKGAFLQICNNYGQDVGQKPERANYLYEELKYMLHSMENGVYEVQSYEEFGKRTGISQYRKLMSLLIQNNKKGTSNILQQLEAEAKENFEHKKMEARRLGEKAGTKLLLPMIMMLGIVMVIIIIPAFLSYQI